MKTPKITDWRLWVASVLSWTLFSLLYGGSNYYWHLAAHHAIPFYDAAWLHLLNCWIDAFLTPVVFVVSAAHPVNRKSWKRSIPLHALGMLAFTAAHMAIRLFVYPVRNQFTDEVVNRSLIQLWRMFLYGIHSEGVTAYLLTVIVAQLMYFKVDSQEKAIAVEQMRRAAAETRLQALKLQLQPHFLFNSLNASAELIHTQPDVAERMLFSIADLLREIVSGMPSLTHSLAQEMAFTSTFCAIEQIRFAGRLKIESNIPDELLPCTVPSMLLQPLVENAIKHGMSTSQNVLTVSISALVLRGRLELTVSDDGRGLTRDPLRGSNSGTGIRNTRERLQHLYPGEHSFRIVKRTPAGTVVSVIIPLHTADRAPSVQAHKPATIQAD